jgi:hypothetical protein
VEVVITVEKDLSKLFTDTMARAADWGPPEVWTKSQACDVARPRMGDKDGATTKQNEKSGRMESTVEAGDNCNLAEAGDLGAGPSQSPTKGAAGQMQKLSVGDVPIHTDNVQTGKTAFLMPMEDIIAALDASRCDKGVSKALGEMCKSAGVSTQPEHEVKWKTVVLDVDKRKAIQEGIGAMEALAEMDENVRSRVQKVVGTTWLMEMVQDAAEVATWAISEAKGKNQREVAELMATPTEEVVEKLGRAMSNIRHRCREVAKEAATLVHILETQEWKRLWKGHATRAMLHLGGDDVTREGKERVTAVVTERIDELANDMKATDEIAVASDGICTWAKQMATSEHVKNEWDAAKTSGKYGDVIYVASTSLEYAIGKIRQLARQPLYSNDIDQASEEGQKADDARSGGETTGGRKRTAEEEPEGQGGDPQLGTERSPTKKTREQKTAQEQAMLVEEAVSQHTRSRSVTPASVGESRQGNGESPPPTPGEEGSK